MSPLALDQLFEECQHPNWDGYDAFAVLPATRDNAERFLQALPDGLANPDLSADPGGEISFEWGCGKWTISISIDANSNLLYAAWLGDFQPAGECKFEGELPDEILTLLFTWTSDCALRGQSQ